MSIEDASIDGSMIEAIRKRIAERVSPEDIERKRAEFYSAAQAGDKSAAMKLRALPPKNIDSRSKRADISAVSKATSDPFGEPGAPSQIPVPEMNPVEGAMQRAFPKERKEDDPWQSDPLAGAIGTSAMLAPAMAVAGAPLVRLAAGAGEAIPGIGGTIASGGVKLAGGAALGAGGAYATGGDPREGAILGAVLAAPGAGLDVMRDPRVPTSRVFNAAESAGGSVGVRGATGMRPAEVQGLPFGEEGAAELGVRATNKLLPEMESRVTDNKTMIEGAEDDLTSRLGDELVDSTEMRNALQGVRRSRSMDNGDPTNAAITNEVDRIDRLLQKPGVPGVRVVGGARGSVGTPDSYEPLTPTGGHKGEPPTSDSYSPLTVTGGAEGARSSGIRYDRSGRMILPTEEVSSGAGASYSGGELIPGSPGVNSGHGAVPRGGRLIPGSEPVMSGTGARYESIPGKPMNEVTLREAIAIKKGLRDSADLDGPATPESNAARVVAGKLSDVGHRADTAYDAALTRYGEEASRLERANDVFGGRDVQELPGRAGLQRAMQRKLGSLGTDDKLLTRQALEVAAENPEWSDLINAIVARNGLRLRLSGGGSPNSTAWRAALGSSQAAALRLGTPLGKLSNLNYPAIPLETAALEEGKKRRALKSKKEIEAATAGEF